MRRQPDAALVDLGRALFFDPNLSLNRNAVVRDLSRFLRGRSSTAAPMVSAERCRWATTAVLWAIETRRA